MTNTQTNRETWLHLAKVELQKDIFSPAKLTIPSDVQISVGFMHGGRGKQKSVLGQNFARFTSEGNVNNIIINPSLHGRANTLDVLETLAHELIHAIDDNKSGHGKEFRRMALSIGFMSPMRTTPASEELKENLNKIIEKIGEFPHDKMDVSNIKKQGTRNKKVACLSCDFSFRTSQKNIDNMVILDCPACEEEDALIVV